MVKFHTNHGVYNLGLRGSYSNVRSEKHFRKLVEVALNNWAKRSPAVAASLREKWENGKEFEVIAFFGMTSWKERVS